MPDPALEQHTIENRQQLLNVEVRAVRYVNFCSGDFRRIYGYFVRNDKNDKTLPFTGGFAGGGTVFT
jgi:hypothetical protein